MYFILGERNLLELIGKEMVSIDNRRGVSENRSGAGEVV